MKFEVGPELMGMVKDAIATMGVADTIENRQKFIHLVLGTGISQLYFCAGLSEQIASEFPGNDAASLVSEPEPEPEETPEVCLECGKPVIHNGRTWACNCRTYENPPPPVDVEYVDGTKKTIQPAPWSNSFPT